MSSTVKKFSRFSDARRCLGELLDCLMLRTQDGSVVLMSSRKIRVVAVVLFKGFRDHTVSCRFQQKNTAVNDPEPPSNGNPHVYYFSPAKSPRIHAALNSPYSNPPESACFLWFLRQNEYIHLRMCTQPAQSEVPPAGSRYKCRAVTAQVTGVMIRLATAPTLELGH